MSLQRCMQETTHREYLVWQRWLQDEWSNPSRTDNYLMQIAQRILQAASPKQWKSYTLDQQKLGFTFEKRQTPRRQTKEQAAAASKARWFGWLGIRRK